MKRTSQNPQIIIITALEKLKNPTWKELQKETKLSNGALSKHLNLLIKYDRVETIIDTSKVPRIVRYTNSPISKTIIPDVSSDEVLKDEKMSKVLIGFSVQSGYLISKLKDRDKAKELLKDYMNFNLDAMASNIPLFLEFAIKFSDGFMDGRKEKDPLKQKNELAKRISEYWIKDFIGPWIESLALTSFYNKDIQETVYDNIRKERRKEISALSFLDKIKEISLS